MVVVVAGAWAVALAVEIVGSLEASVVVSVVVVVAEAVYPQSSRTTSMVDLAFALLELSVSELLLLCGNESDEENQRLYQLIQLPSPTTCLRSDTIPSLHPRAIVSTVGKKDVSLRRRPRPKIRLAGCFGEQKTKRKARFRIAFQTLMTGRWRTSRSLAGVLL